MKVVFSSSSGSKVGVGFPSAPLLGVIKSINILRLQLPVWSRTRNGSSEEKLLLLKVSSGFLGAFFWSGMDTKGHFCSSCVKIYLCSNPEGMVAP